MPTTKVVVKPKTKKPARKKTATVKRKRKTASCCPHCGQIGEGLASTLLKKAISAYLTSLGTSPDRARTGAHNVKTVAGDIYRIYRLYKDQVEKQRV